MRNPDGSYYNVWGDPLDADSSLSPDEDAVRIMSRIAADLERVVRRHPTQWFNFYRFWEEPAHGAGGGLRSPSAQPEEASARV